MVGWTRLYRAFLRTLGTPRTWQRSSQSKKICISRHSRNTVKAALKGQRSRPVIAGTVQLGLRHDQTLMPTSYAYATISINHMQLNHHHACEGSPRPSVGRAASCCSKKIFYHVCALLIASMPQTDFKLCLLRTMYFPPQLLCNWLHVRIRGRLPIGSSVMLKP